MKPISTIEQTNSAGTATYTLYDAGNITRVIHKALSSAQQSHTEDLHSDDMDESCKQRLVEAAEERYRPLAAKILDVEGFANLDFLFKDQVSEAFYKRYTDLLAEKLHVSTMQKITTSNIVILISFSPGSVISNFVFPDSEAPKSAHIIIMDHNLVKYCEFSLIETCALLLHELGHVFNNPDDQSQKEFYADYFAKQNNFGPQLSSALRKLMDKGLEFIPVEFQCEIEERIKALNNKQSPLIGTLKLSKL